MTMKFKMKENENITLLLVDDHSVVREGIRSFLETQDKIEIIGEADTGEKAVEICREFAPDVILLDLLMSGINGVETTRQIKVISPRSQIIILTSFHEDEFVLPAIKAGALSYLLKDVNPSELAEAVYKAAQGEAILHPQIASILIDGLRGKTKSKTDPDALTTRETEVLLLIAEGSSNAEIGEKLFISKKTVKSHVSNILSKLHLADRTKAAAYAWRNKLIK